MQLENRWQTNEKNKVPRGAIVSILVATRPTNELNCFVFIILCRYDNEYGYSHRVIDLLTYIYSRDHSG